MTEKYPTWLTGHVKEWAEKRLPTVTLCSTTGNELLEVWYYGDLLTVKGEPQSYTSTFAARKRKWQRASPSIRMLPSDSESKLEWRDWHDRDR